MFGINRPLSVGDRVESTENFAIGLHDICTHGKADQGTVQALAASARGLLVTVLFDSHSRSGTTHVLRERLVKRTGFRGPDKSFTLRV